MDGFIPPVPTGGAPPDEQSAASTFRHPGFMAAIWAVICRIPCVPQS
jgi:hypothetical protein